MFQRRACPHPCAPPPPSPVCAPASTYLDSCCAAAVAPLCALPPHGQLQPMLPLYVGPIVDRLDGTEVTIFTLVRLAAGVPEFVAAQGVVVAGPIFALVAGVRFFARVLAHVQAQVGLGQ